AGDPVAAPARRSTGNLTVKQAARAGGTLAFHGKLDGETSGVGSSLPGGSAARTGRVLGRLPHRPAGGRRPLRGRRPPAAGHPAHARAPREAVPLAGTRVPRGPPLRPLPPRRTRLLPVDGPRRLPAPPPRSPRPRAPAPARRLRRRALPVHVRPVPAGAGRGAASRAQGEPAR